MGEEGGEKVREEGGEEMVGEEVGRRWWEKRWGGDGGRRDGEEMVGEEVGRRWWEKRWGGDGGRRGGEEMVGEEVGRRWWEKRVGRRRRGRRRRGRRRRGRRRWEIVSRHFSKGATVVLGGCRGEESEGVRRKVKGRERGREGVNGLRPNY